ncbi:pseudoazurin [Mesorhizobium sp. ZMM04-5]|uniref:Pseudoazurin n=1 Tax=Mesorhizobium marinum TaxID=3228790 RepID=A0ABV3R2X0_9HYPH
MRSQILALFLSLSASSSALAEMHEVRMLNRGAAGPMVYEPEFVHARPGDTAKFLNGSRGHNAVTVDGMLPEKSSGFKGNLNEEIEVSLDQEGFYGIKCSPHYAMGMVMVIRVGDAALPDDFVRADVPARARRRFGEIIARAGLAQ